MVPSPDSKYENNRLSSEHGFALLRAARAKIRVVENLESYPQTENQTLDQGRLGLVGKQEGVMNKPIITQCMFERCWRVKLPDGTWTAQRVVLGLGKAVRISHGICPTCHAACLEILDLAQRQPWIKNV